MRMPRSRVRPWPILIAVPAGVALAACSGTNAISTAQTQRPAVLAGLAVQCSGLPDLPAHPVTAIAMRDHRVVAHRTELGSFTYRFVLPPGHYVVTTDQSSVVPVSVSLGQGQHVHADLNSACD